jgi:hypothetical protein
MQQHTHVVRLLLDLQQIPEAEVTIGGRTFTEVGAVAEGDIFLFATDRMPGLHDVSEARRLLQTMLNEAAHHDCSGVDHRIVRDHFGIEADIIEIPSTRFATDVAVHFILAEFVERHEVGDGLRRRLNTELAIRLADREELTVHAAEGHSEPGLVGEGELGTEGGVTNRQQEKL